MGAPAFGVPPDRTHQAPPDATASPATAAAAIIGVRREGRAAAGAA